MLKFAPIMPAFCSLLFHSYYYAKIYAGKIDLSLTRGFNLPQRQEVQREISSADDVPKEPKVMDKSFNTDSTQRELQELVEKLPVLENNMRTLKEEWTICSLD